jgi:hypothetical protein
VYWFSFPKVDRLEREVNHFSASIAEYMNEWSCTSKPLYYLMEWAENTFTLLYWCASETGKLGDPELERSN